MFVFKTLVLIPTDSATPDVLFTTSSLASIGEITPTPIFPLSSAITLSVNVRLVPAPSHLAIICPVPVPDSTED